MTLDLPPLDRERSPLTGFTLDHWRQVADELLLALRAFATDDYARILPPGRPSISGSDSDGLEGFARSFLLASCLLAGRDGHDPHDHASRYAAGIASGTDPKSPNAWPDPSQTQQAKVEAALFVAGLEFSRPWVWDRLDQDVRERTLAWLGTIIGTTYWDNNWVWFRILVLTFLRQEDPRFDPASGNPAEVAALRADLEHDLAMHETFAGQGGWFRDGVLRAVDHYNTWAFPVFPTLWMQMRGFAALRADGIVSQADEQRHRERVAQFTVDALGMIGADGEPLVQGRSLIYRAAVAAPQWCTALLGLDQQPGQPLSSGRLRRAASGILAHFLNHGVPDAEGLLNLGWFDAFPEMTQTYSGPGSPYWICLGFLGLALGPEHPVWTAVEEPLPVEQGDGVQVLPTAGWIVDRRQGDGIVRIINHGTDHAQPGMLLADDPLYARFGYSTVTSPPMVPGTAIAPLDQSVAVIDPELGWSHRTGFSTLELRLLDEHTALAISRQHCHWLADDVVLGPWLTVASLVRGGIEVRIVRADQDLELPLGIAGWPLSGPEPAEQAADGSLVLDRPDEPALRSTLVPLAGQFTADVVRLQGVSPLGPELAAPRVIGAGDLLRQDDIVAVVVRLSLAQTPLQQPRLDQLADGALQVTWPDGQHHQVRLPD